jgi:hypothetical protein
MIVPHHDITKGSTLTIGALRRYPCLSVTK